MRPALVTGVAVLVVLAGCPATVGNPPPGGTADGTVTPAPVPTSTPTAQYPPGVSESHVTAPELAAAHEHALEGTNYTLVIRQHIHGPNGTVQRVNETRRVLADEEAYAVRFNRSVSEFTIRQPIGTAEYWVDEDGYAIRKHERGQLAHLGRMETGSPIGDVDGSRAINRTASALRLAVTTPSDGTVALVVTGRRSPDTLPSPTYVYDERNVSGTYRVRADGLVTDWRVAYDATVGDRPVRVVRETHVRQIGSTTIERPAWVDETRNRSGT